MCSVTLGQAARIPGINPADISALRIYLIARKATEGQGKMSHQYENTKDEIMQVIPFVPSHFVVPPTLETEEFCLRMLTVHDVVKDYDAVMSSVEHCQTIWGGKWPQGLTLEQNLIDLGWHQKEFQTRRSFTYTVVQPSEAMVLGCVYILPTRKPGYDAEVYLWARQSELAGGLEDRLYVAVQGWLALEWPFPSVAYPGRSVPWETWQSLPDERR